MTRDTRRARLRVLHVNAWVRLMVKRPRFLSRLFARWRARRPPASTQERGFSFDQVFAAERQLLGNLSRSDAAGKAEGLQEELLGLALSGGGIRSATFNLGVLQGLSELKLLQEFDYLSTVSGGGYIGSWLSAWIHRADQANLVDEEREKRPHHTPGVETVQEQLGLHTPTHKEPKEVTFLRSYSNYLTPRAGLFSTDSLAAVATYLRNLTLNLAILLLCLTVVLLLPRMVAWGGHFGQQWPAALLVAAALGLAVAVYFINLNLASQLPNSESSRDKERLGSKWTAPRYATRGAVLVRIVLPLTLAALALGFWLAGPRPTLAELFVAHPWWWTISCAGLVLVTTVAIGFIWFCALKVAGVKRHAGDRPTWKWRLSGLAIGLLIGLLALVAFQKLLFPRPSFGTPHLWRATVWGLPGLFGVFWVAVVFVVGVSGRQFEEDSREWWSRLGGVLFGIAMGWLVLAGLAVHAPLWVIEVTQVAKGLSVAWLVTTVAGVRAAMNGSTGKPGTTSWRNRLAIITPYVFLAGLLVAVAFMIHAALAAGHGHGPFIPGAVDYFEYMTTWLSWQGLLVPFAISAGLALFFSWRVDVNLFGLHMFYRNRLVRCYLGASNRERADHPFTGFDGNDSVPMKQLQQRPYHLVNGALNITRGARLAWQERKAASFIASPLYCGYDLGDDTRAGSGTYQPTQEFLAEDNRALLLRTKEEEELLGLPPTPPPDPRELKLGLGTALAVSGAAASPNQGYHSAPPVAFLMTVFNVRLGWWLQNPRYRDVWRAEGPRWGIIYLLRELVGMADESASYVYVSDGGHFENLGIYELVRRRCRFIVVCDAGCDPGFEFEDLGNAIRKCQVDLGVSIDIGTRTIRPDPSTQRSLVHCAVGTIRYERSGQRTADGTPIPDGYLLYIKPSLTGSEPGDVLQYWAAHAEFPHESTSDQWFGESQFESYRKLGLHITRLVFEGVPHLRGPAGSPPGREAMFVALKERWYPSSAAVKASFSRHADRLNTLQVALRRDESLRFLDGQIYPEWDELMKGRALPPRASLSLPSSPTQIRAGFYFCNNLLELMQSVYLDLNLEEDHDHPDNRGWMNLFKHWSWATMLRATYAICCSTFGARFQTFCKRHLGLEPGEVRIVTRPDGPRSEQVLDAKVLDKILTEAEPRGELNFWELKLIRERAGNFDQIHLLRLKVDDPSRIAANRDAAPALEFTFGFALTRGDQFVYFRVQDHLRRMGLARDALLKLCRMDYRTVSVSQPVREEEERDPEAWRRFRMLLSSALQEDLQARRQGRG